MKCKITEADAHGFHTSFTIRIDEENHGNSPQGLIHRIGRLVGKELEELEGLEFTIKVIGQKEES